MNNQPSSLLVEVIISASRRTDIPAFFSEWFLKRIEEGFVCVVNPFNPRQVRRFSILANAWTPSRR